VSHRIAFVTCQTLPSLVPDDRLVADILRSRGIGVTPVVWDDPAVRWTTFAAVVIRSTWDYHLKAAAFSDWLRRRAEDGTRLWNPPGVVQRNLHKRYLADLGARGVAVVATRFIDAGRGERLADILEASNWREAVVKPAISASAYGTWRTSLATAAEDQQRFEQQSRDRDLLVQPYMRAIETPGEWSLIFFAGEYSHAVLKQPADGDFRVQEELGGRASLASASADLVAQAQVALSNAGPLLYARVDGVEHDGRFVLMELEITEPYLFVGLAGGAAARFADAIEAVARFLTSDA